jgi:hypothetical protein
VKVAEKERKKVAQMVLILLAVCLADEWVGNLVVLMVDYLEIFVVGDLDV